MSKPKKKHRNRPAGKRWEKSTRPADLGIRWVDSLRKLVKAMTGFIIVATACIVAAVQLIELLRELTA